MVLHSQGHTSPQTLKTPLNFPKTRGRRDPKITLGKDQPLRNNYAKGERIILREKGNMRKKVKENMSPLTWCHGDCSGRLIFPVFRHFGAFRDLRALQGRRSPHEGLVPRWVWAWKGAVKRNKENEKRRATVTSTIIVREQWERERASGQNVDIVFLHHFVSGFVI